MTSESRNDMVYDRNGNPAFCNSPESCRRWLRNHLETDQSIWQYKVRRHQDLKHVSVTTYLGGKA